MSTPRPVQHRFTMSTSPRGAWFFWTGLGMFLLVAGALLPSIGCGGGGAASAATDTADAIRVTVTPITTSLATGASMSLTAYLTGSHNQGLTWTVDGIVSGNTSAGTITGTGGTVTYTAPAVPGSHTVVAASVVNPSRKATTVITVTQAAVQVTLTPATSSVASGGSLSFTAAVTGSSNTSVVWSVDGVASGNTTAGTLAGSGASVTYAAPSAAGTHTVTATSAADTTRSASAVVTVQAPLQQIQAPVAVTASPASASLNTGGAIAITAAVTGSSNTAVAWTVDGVASGNATAGTITGTGNSVTYTAPAAAGSHIVKATSAADGSQSATTAVSVLAPAVVVTANPPALSVATSGTASITASVSGTSNTAVTWSVDGVANGNSTVGTVTGTGNTATYKAPAAAGSHSVVAASAANPAATATTLVTVQSSALPAVTVALASAGGSTLNTSGSGLYKATVAGSSNTAVTWSVDGVANGNATVGTINTGAAMGGVNNQGNQVLYLAPAATGSHTITATSAANPGASASATVAVAANAYTVVKPGSVFNVTSYGAVADGSSDSSAAFASAIAAASANGGGVVNVPAASKPYEIACNHSGFGYFGVLLQDNVTLQISAGATVQAKSGAPDNCCLIGVAGSNVNIIGGGVLDGNIGPNPAGGNLKLIFLGIGSNVTVAGITLQNSPLDGLYIEQSTGSTLSGVLVYNVLATGNYRDGLTIDDGSGIVVRDSSFVNSTACGVDIEPNEGENPAGVSIFNCKSSNNAIAGIQSGPDDYNDNGTFSNSVFAFNTLAGNHGFGIYQGNSSSVAILNNTISGTLPYSAGGYPGHGIMLNDTSVLGVTSDQILGNTISNSSASGIYSLNCHTTNIGYNVITGSGAYGIDNADGSATVEKGTNTGSANASGNTNGSSF